jgi:hypothetical protein
MNKKFCEEPIAYFSLYYTDCIENEKIRRDAQADTQIARRSHKPPFFKIRMMQRNTHRQQGDIVSLLS